MKLGKTETYRTKARRKRESKNAKQMRNTKQNCFSHSFASPQNDKQCSAKQCFANAKHETKLFFTLVCVTLKR